MCVPFLRAPGQKTCCFHRGRSWTEVVQGNFPVLIWAIYVVKVALNDSRARSNSVTFKWQVFLKEQYRWQSVTQSVVSCCVGHSFLMAECWEFKQPEHCSEKDTLSRATNVLTGGHAGAVGKSSHPDLRQQSRDCLSLHIPIQALGTLCLGCERSLYCAASSDFFLWLFSRSSNAEGLVWSDCENELWIKVTVFLCMQGALGTHSLLSRFLFR